MSELAKMVKADRHWSRIEALVDEQGITDTSLEGLRFDIQQIAAAGARAGYAQAFCDIADWLDDQASGDTPRVFIATGSEFMEMIEPYLDECGINLEAGT